MHKKGSRQSGQRGTRHQLSETLSRHITLTLDHITTPLGPESNQRIQFASSSAVYTLTRFGRCSDSHGGGAYYPGLVVLSGYDHYSRSRVAETTTRGAQPADGRSEQSANAAMNAAVTGLTEAVRTLGQTV